MIPDPCFCGCTERLDENGQLDPCDNYLEYLDCLDSMYLDQLGSEKLVDEDAFWEGLRAA